MLDQPTVREAADIDDIDIDRATRRAWPMTAPVFVPLARFRDQSLAEALTPDLVSEMTTQRAAAVLDALTLAEVWMELVETQGWTADEYEAWLRQVLGHQLLGGVVEQVSDPGDAG